MVNNISENTISEILARKELNALNKIKNAEIKNKRLIPKQKELLNLFDNLVNTILTDNENHNDNHNDNHIIIIIIVIIMRVRMTMRMRMRMRM